VESVYNVFRAIKGSPVTDKFVTIAGEVENPVTVCAPIGTKIKDLLKAAGGAKLDDYALIAGGPMMGKIISENDVVTKTTNAVIILPENHNVVLNKKRNPKVSLKRAMSVCCQCRTCTELCSRHVAGYPVEPHMVMRVLSNGGKGDINSLAGSLFCSGCGLCESYSCPQSLSPRQLIDELKKTAKKNGFSLPKDIKADENIKDAEYKRVSVERLTSRLGLKKYDVSAPFTDEFKTESVKALLSQHIGVSSVPVVKEGDNVTKGQVIAKAAEGALSVNIHASIDGKITRITEKYIKIN
jgi:Na+-translocating ferredoxin:NAD+ oxidoreductase RnfC subunit